MTRYGMPWQGSKSRIVEWVVDILPPGCVEIARTQRTTSMAAKSTDKRTERIFVQERFYDQCKPLTLFDMEVD